MSAMAALLVGLGVLLIWSALDKNRPLFVGPNAVIGQVLRGDKK